MATTAPALVNQYVPHVMPSCMPQGGSIKTDPFTDIDSVKLRTDNLSFPFHPSDV